MVSAAQTQSALKGTCSASAGLAAPRNRPNHQLARRLPSARSRSSARGGLVGRMETKRSRRARPPQLLRRDSARHGALLLPRQQRSAARAMQLALGRGAAGDHQAQGIHQGSWSGQAHAHPPMRTDRRAPTPCRRLLCVHGAARCCRLTDDLRCELGAVEKLSKRPWTKIKYRTQDKRFLVRCRGARTAPQAWWCAACCLLPLPASLSACCCLPARLPDCTAVVVRAQRRRHQADTGV